jgi:hypothetical protein
VRPLQIARRIAEDAIVMPQPARDAAYPVVEATLKRRLGARPRAFVPGQAPRHALISGGLSAADSAAPHREVTVRGPPPPGPLPLAAPPGSLSAAGGALADWRGKARAWATSEAEAWRRNALGADGP